MFVLPTVVLPIQAPAVWFMAACMCSCGPGRHSEAAREEARRNLVGMATGHIGNCGAAAWASLALPVLHEVLCGGVLVTRCRGTAMKGDPRAGMVWLREAVACGGCMRRSSAA